MLREGVPLRGEVFVDHYQYYSFDVGSHKDVKRVVIQVSSTQGDAGLFVSRQVQFPTHHNAEKAACYCNSVLHYDASELTETSKMLYIGIFGLTNANFYINVLIQRTHQDSVVYKLYPGVPQKINLLGSSEFAYIDVYLTNLQAAELSVSQATGKFQIFEARIRSQEDLQAPQFKYLTSNKHFLVIREGAESTLAFVRLKVQQLDSSLDLQFTIQLEESQSKIIEIFEGLEKPLSLNYKDSVQFQFEISARNSRYMVLHTSLQRGLTLRISTDVQELQDNMATDS